MEEFEQMMEMISKLESKELALAAVEQVDPAYLRKQPLPALLRVPSVVSRNLVPTAA